MVARVGPLWRIRSRNLNLDLHLVAWVGLGLHGETSGPRVAGVGVGLHGETSGPRVACTRLGGVYSLLLVPWVVLLALAMLESGTGFVFRGLLDARLLPPA